MLVTSLVLPTMNHELRSPDISLGAAAARQAPGLAGLVEQMAQGRQDALARLYDETSSMINGLLLRILERPEDAEEVLLDVYMKAWKYAGRYAEKRGTVRAWLMIMARNAGIDRIRQRRAQPRTLAFEPETTPEPVSAELSPEEQTSEQQRRRRVEIVLRELPPEQRAAVELAFFGGLTHAELAERLGEPLGTIKSRIRMALQRLRGLMEESAL
jgi:RNA polymerase sigma-70 factor (ECF subfamily)